MESFPGEGTTYYANDNLQAYADGTVIGVYQLIDIHKVSVERHLEDV